MSDSSMLDRLVNTLKRDIAPAIDDEFLKTQAYMSSVVVGKLARQLALESGHRASALTDIDLLVADLKHQLTGLEQAALLKDPLQALEAERSPSALSALIETLYEERAQLGDDAFGQLLGRIRQTLRADIDCRMVYAR